MINFDVCAVGQLFACVVGLSGSNSRHVESELTKAMRQFARIRAICTCSRFSIASSNMIDSYFIEWALPFRFVNAYLR